METVFSNLKEILAEKKKKWSRRETLSSYATLPRAKPNILVTAARYNLAALRKHNIQRKSSQGISRKRLVTRNMKSENFGRSNIYSPLHRPPNFKNRNGRACFCTACAVILLLLIPLLTALMPFLKKAVSKLERNYRKNWWYRNLALRLEAKAPQWDLFNNKRGLRCLDPSL